MLIPATFLKAVNLKHWGGYTGMKVILISIYQNYFFIACLQPTFYQHKNAVYGSANHSLK